jgi:tetratricopeptide (TPR) repeat protein/O-antigen ligase
MSGSISSSVPLRPPARSRHPWSLIPVDVGIIGILAFAPFFMGGRQALGQLVLCVLSSLTALAWCIHQWRERDGRWRFTGVEPLILLGLGLILLQCQPLNSSLLKALSPRVQKLLPEWGEASSAVLPGLWNRISFTPNDTWSNLIVILACVQFFFVAAQRLKTVNDLHRMVRIVAIGGFVMALFGTIQYLYSNGKFFWLYQHPMTDTRHAAKGAFANANHFANFLAMALPAQALLIIDRLARVKRNRTGIDRWKFHLRRIDLQLCLWCLLLATTGLAIFLSKSHSGILSSVVGLVILVMICWRKSLLTTFSSAIALSLIIIWLALLPLFGEFGNWRSHRAAASKASGCLMDLWKADLHGIEEFPLAGTGLGSHQEVYWLWFNAPQDGHEYSHAENGFLQIALETGLTGLGIVLLLWLTALLWCAQGLWNAATTRSGGVMAVATAGLGISLTHSMTDFVWYVPACINIVLLYGVCAWRISLMRFFETPRRESADRLSVFNAGVWSWRLALPAVLLLGYWMLREKIPEVAAEPIWHRYLRLTLEQQRDPADNAERQADLLQRRIQLALQAAKANPRAHRIQLHAGMACLKQFALNQQNTQHYMPLSQIRDAARNLIGSPDEMRAWLDRPGILGEQRQLLEQAMFHFRASLRACPLQPRPYLELAELVWLDGRSETAERELIEQAVTARPNDARAQFAMGRMLWLNGEQRAAAVHWQRAFRLDADYREHLIEALSTYVPARFFLEHFDPDLSGLRQLREAYRLTDDKSGYQLVLESLAKFSAAEAASSNDRGAEEKWRLAHECYVELGDHKNARKTAEAALAAQPDSYAAHHLYAIWLYQNGYFAEASDQLTWCIRQRPSETTLVPMAEDARQRAARGELPVRYAESPGGVRR